MRELITNFLIWFIVVTAWGVTVMAIYLAVFFDDPEDSDGRR